MPSRNKVGLPRAATILLVLILLSQGALAARRGGRKKRQRHSGIYYDRSCGLYLPKYPEAAAWLREFWKTGKPRRTDGQFEGWKALNAAEAPATGVSAVAGPGPESGNVPARRAWLKPFQGSSIQEEEREQDTKLIAAPGVSELGQRATICGQPVGKTARRTNLLVVPAGTVWKAEKWYDRPEAATFDVVAIYHGKKPNFTCPLCAGIVQNRGAKWRLYLDFTELPEWEEIASRYEYIMLPDDDLQMDTCAINKVFDIMKEYDLIMGQPSVCRGKKSGTWRHELMQHPEYIVRFTTFVEVMAPTYRMDFFHNVVRRTFSKQYTYVGWGLDSLWPALLHFPKDRIGVVDAVCITHIPTEGGLGVNGKENSVYAPGLSPYTAKQEETIVFAAFNYCVATLAALGEDWMPMRVYGGVPNIRVLKIMAEMADDIWPSKKIADTYDLKLKDLMVDEGAEGQQKSVKSSTKSTSSTTGSSAKSGSASGGGIQLNGGNNRTLSAPMPLGPDEISERWTHPPSFMTMATVAMVLMLGVMISQPWSIRQRALRRQRSLDAMKR